MQSGIFMLREFIHIATKRSSIGTFIVFAVAASAAAAAISAATGFALFASYEVGD